LPSQSVMLAFASVVILAQAAVLLWALVWITARMQRALDGMRDVVSSVRQISVDKGAAGKLEFHPATGARIIYDEFGNFVR
jgi:hypothetical protein